MAEMEMAEVEMAEVEMAEAEMGEVQMAEVQMAEVEMAEMEAAEVETQEVEMAGAVVHSQPSAVAVAAPHATTAPTTGASPLCATTVHAVAVDARSHQWR